MPPSSRPGMPDPGAGGLDRSQRRRLVSDLRGAIGRGEMAVHYQPRISLADGRIAGAEALLRWHHPILGDIPPDTFIPIAEATDLILRLGGWVLRQAAREAAGWPVQAGNVSVNVSARQLECGLLSSQVAAALAESGLPPSRLELELTESLAPDDTPEIRRLLMALRDEGIGLALDDFGTGYGSLARLRRLPFTAIKLDRSFLRWIPEDPDDVAILRAVHDLSVALRIRLVAEGVEEEAQRHFLAKLGCEEAQGWLFGRAGPAAALHRHWAAGHPLAGCAGDTIPPDICCSTAPRIPSPAPRLAGSPSSAPDWPASPALAR